jgi:TolB-like protein/DNA-binding winged helix-turn-helix (wHTH) protein
MDQSKHGLASSRFAHFGPCCVDLCSCELFKDGARRHIQNHSYQILTMLLERPGVVVTREELRMRLWKAQEFVDFDQGLNTAMLRLRHALDDAADTPRFIETLPRQGYRLIAVVAFSDEATNCEKASTEPVIERQRGGPDGIPGDRSQIADKQLARSWRSRTALMAAATVVTLILLTIGFASGKLPSLLGSQVGAKALPTLAVLPFDSLSDDPAQKFLAEGMTEELITELGKDREVQVISRGSVMQYEGKHLPLDVVANQLHADDVLEGSVIESGGRLRITANLYRVATRRHLWAESYEKPVADSLSAQREIVLDMARNIQAQLTSH